eukprot:TRINITY_DN2860_c0_g1_i1.p1 TRINITY_DN2860_c0_g1~~TRINITY_DN2860_c0_g1_i1.p1  ORF type:complete len:699 (+),score=132.14 TRINITY_DN2860_c0_g1_i1:64-2160(+)
MSSNSESPRESPRRNIKKSNTNTKKSQKSNGSGSNGTAAKKKNGLSPFHKAAKNGELETLKDLLTKDPNLLNSLDGDNKCTALYHACRRGKIDIVNYLIEKGADVNLGDKTGKNPLHLTARSTRDENFDCFKALIKASTIDVNAGDYLKRTALHMAVCKGRQETVRLLVTHDKINVNVQDVDGITPLHLVYRFSREGFEEILFENKDLNVNLEDRMKRTPLHLAILKARETSVEKLIARGANVNARDEDDNTPIHLASERGYLSIVTLLIRHNAEISPLNKDGIAPVRLAVKNEHEDIANVLINNGADVSVRYDPTLERKKREKRFSERPANQSPKSRSLSSSTRRNSMESYSTSEEDESASVTNGEELPPPKVDRWGFMKGNSDSDIEETEEEKQKREAMEWLRTKKWVKMIKRWDSFIDSKLNKVKRRVYKGIPERVRGQAWVLLTECTKLKESKQNTYKGYRESKAKEKIMHQIDLDINRSNRNHVDFKERYGKMQISLFNVLKAYSVYDSEVGYCQGMSDICSVLLMFVEEEEVFWMLIQLCEHQKFLMKGKWEDGFPLLKRSFFVHGKILEKQLPKLYNHLEKQNVHKSYYLTKWFIKLFLDTFSFEVVMRIWDIFFLEGFDIMYTVTYLIFKNNEAQLLTKDFDGIISILQKKQKVDDVDRFFKDLYKFKISSRFIRECEAEFKPGSDPMLD